MILMLVLFRRTRQNERVYITVIHYQGDPAGDEILRAFGRMRYSIRSKTLRADFTEMAVEVFCRPNDTAFLERVRSISGVQDVTLVQYNGEYHG